MKIYLAGPEVFLPNAKDILKQKSKLARQHGFTPLAPGDNVLDLTSGLFDQGLQINGFDEKLMNEADGILANLTPFRGLGADPGTCYELGYICAQAKTAFAYTNDVRNHYTRIVEHFSGEISEGADGRPYDPHGLALENFDMADNLMLIGGIVRRGGEIIVHDATSENYYTDMAGYEETLRRMAKACL